ncbi:MAG: 50S ribosomal protein L6 [Candidatus Xenobia bacterium]
MSRIGKQPILLPKGVSVTVNGTTVKVKGPKGELSREVSSEMKLEVSATEVKVARPSDEDRHRALHGLTRTLVNNMVKGVTDGYTRYLDMVGVGYKAAKQGSALNISIGYSHPVVFEAPKGIEFDVESVRGQGFSLIVKGIDKELVGQTAAHLRSIRPPEPYKGKGIKYREEVIHRKMGKAGKTGK